MKAKANIQTLFSVALLSLVIFLSPAEISAKSEIQNQNLQNYVKRGDKPVVYHPKQHVMVRMRDGKEVPAVITSMKSKKKYYVRQYGKSRHGLVHERYIRKMTSEEEASLKKGR